MQNHIIFLFCQKTDNCVRHKDHMSLFIKVTFMLIFYSYFFYKKLELDLSPQSFLYFQGFWGSKLLNGFLVV